MSHVAYDLQLQDCMNDLLEQIKVEHLPCEKNEAGKEIIETWADPDRFQHLACLYIKYIDIYRKLEDCYDQIVHPQKRIFIKQTLESTICRICELKKELIMYNPRPGSLYVHLDQILFDLKYDPSIIEIPVPRYFKQDDQLPVDIKFTEAVIIEKPKAKKPKRKKKTKKSKKTVEKELPPPMTFAQKDFMLDGEYKKAHNCTDAEVEIIHDTHSWNMDIEMAIRVIQRNERGRQGRGRIMLFLKRMKDDALQEKKKQLARMQKTESQNQQPQISQDQIFAEFISRRIRGILARRKVEEIRNEEMVFLGMTRRPKTAVVRDRDPLKIMDETREHRRKLQENNWMEFQRAKIDIQNEITDIDGQDIEDQMLKERRDWIQDYRAIHGGKPPADITKFYERLNVEEPLSPEEEEKKRLEDEEKAKEKEKKKKDKKKAKKKKKKKDDSEKGPAVAKFGPTEVIQRFDEQYDNFANVWADRSELNNFDQRFDDHMARNEVMPLVEKQHQAQVDDMIKLELANMAILAGIKTKKKKKGKKKKKKKKGKKNRLPGFKYCSELKEYECLVELVQHNIVKKLPAQHLTDFIGEFNFIHSMLDDKTKTTYDPSMALIRQLVTEYIIFPLGSALVRKRFPDLIRSVLFYGPPGTGKTMIVRSIVHETHSVLFDLSPVNIEGEFAGSRQDSEKMVAMVMRAAKEYQPSVIYIDECDKVFPAKKKRKKGAKKAKKNDQTVPQRIKKALKKWRPKWITDETRITIIGCTSDTENGSKKELKKFFDKAIYFPFPDYTTRRLMWRSFIEMFQGIIKPDFPISTLAHISAGYSAGSIKETCEKVLTKFRREHMEEKPLQIQEFIGFLSLCSNTMEDSYADYQKLTDALTGEKSKRDAIEKKILEMNSDGDAKGKKGKKAAGKKKKR